MSGIFKLCTALVLLFSLAVVEVTGWSHGQHTFSDIVLNAMESNPDGSLCIQPCIFGIRMGHTPVEDSLAILRNHPFLKAWQIPQQGEYPRYTRHITLEGMNLSVYSFDGKVVSYVQLAFDPADHEHFLTYGDMVARLGIPDSTCVYPTFPGNSWPLTVVFLGRQTVIYPDKVTVGAQIAAIDIAVSHSTGTRPCSWSGFHT